MKYKYKKYGPGVLRPVIPVEIKHREYIVPYEVLVDSGADMCIFDAQIAEILEIDVTSGEPAEMSGITGVKERQYLHTVTLSVGGWDYKTKVGFLPGIASLGYGVVGQKGFFDRFKVIFDLQTEMVELKKKRHKK